MDIEKCKPLYFTFVNRSLTTTDFTPKSCVPGIKYLHDVYCISWLLRQLKIPASCWNIESYFKIWIYYLVYACCDEYTSCQCVQYVPFVDIFDDVTVINCSFNAYYKPKMLFPTPKVLTLSSHISYWHILLISGDP